MRSIAVFKILQFDERAAGFARDGADVDQRLMGKKVVRRKRPTMLVDVPEVLVPVKHARDIIVPRQTLAQTTRPLLETLSSRFKGLCRVDQLLEERIARPLRRYQFVERLLPRLALLPEG